MPGMQGKNREDCAECIGVGRVDEGRAYRPAFRIQNDLSICDVPQLSRDMLRECSIRTDADCMSHERHVCPPCWLETPGLTVPGMNWAKRARGTKRTVATTNEGHDSVEADVVGKKPFSPEQVDALRKYIAKQARSGVLPKQYGGVAFEGFTCSAYRNRRNVAFVKLESRYCGNIGREHESNTVYLEFDGITQLCYQKCFCRCETTEGRRSRAPNGRALKCSEYRSVAINAHGVCNTLFGRIPSSASDEILSM